MQDVLALHRRLQLQPQKTVEGRIVSQQVLRAGPVGDDATLQNHGLFGEAEPRNGGVVAAMAGDEFRSVAVLRRARKPFDGIVFG